MLKIDNVVAAIKGNFKEAVFKINVRDNIALVEALA